MPRVGKLRQTAVKGLLQWRASYGSRSGEAGMPPHLERDLSESFGSYWRRRADHHSNDSWAGVPMSKFPEDLRTYQHLLWESRADTVIEVGTKWGGSLLWFRDQLRTNASYGRIASPAVVGLDLITGPAETTLDRADPTWREQITLIEGDMNEAATLSRIRAALPADARCLIVEDSAHTGETTRAALDALSPLVPTGGYFVVEDGIVDVPEVHPEPPLIIQTGIRTGGVLAAIDEWLQTDQGAEFKLRPDLELYGITSNPGGFLQRAEME